MILFHRVAAVALMLIATGAAGLPHNHPPIPEKLRRFTANLNCPYASEWLTKGPEKAARDLAERHSASLHRRVEGHVADADDDAMPVEISGSCSYDNVWTGSVTCMEFRSAGTEPSWTEEEMQAKCDEQSGVISVGSDAGTYCGLPAEGKLGGWCVKKMEDGEKVEATMMALGGMMSSTCEAISMACTTFAGGDRFVADGACSSTAGSDSEEEEKEGSGSGAPPKDWAANSSTDTTSKEGGPGGPICVIAPGPAGAAHQAPFSAGYRSDCPDTPAQSSPYQWPLRFSVDTEMKSVAYESDDITFLSKSKVWYRLDKNWKRSDNFMQKGKVPFFSQSTTDGEYIDTNERNTIIHRGSKMYFLTYKDDELLEDDVNNIAECNWLDLGIVGNIRPDWYLDSRGSATDAMYIGNQHVYYPGSTKGTTASVTEPILDEAESSAGAAGTTPRLVKQWRKKDFASQYFTMSMMEHAGDDGIHWPLIINVPGEGFGDDMLQYYSNHELLDEDFVEPFLLDEAFIASGGVCNNLRPDGEGGGGPPTDMEYVPSNLEIDESAWRTNVWTGSPVWEPPAEEKSESDGASSIVGGLAMTDAGPSTVVTSCYDANKKAVELSITYSDLTAPSDGSFPWLGLAFRDDEECLMNPRGGGDQEVALIMTDEFDSLTALHYMMPASTKQGSGVAAGRNSLGFVPLEDKDEYSDVSVDHSDTKDSVTFKFSKVMESIPETMYLTYAVGMSSTFGYHNVRTCFSVEEFPACAAGSSISSPTDGKTVPMPMSADDTSSGAFAISTTMVMSALGVAAVFLGSF